MGRVIPKIGEKYSGDSKVRVLSLEEFIKGNWYFVGLSAKDFLKPTTKPEEYASYYRFASDKLVCVYYSSQITNYGMDSKAALSSIHVAYRDGKTEYEVFDTRIRELEGKLKEHKRSKSIRQQLEELKKAKQYFRCHLPKFRETSGGTIKPFTEYLIDTGYKTPPARYTKKYVVFDVETNGLRRASDDLLSLTILDPFTGMAYNRFLPLDLQPVVLTSYINGITDETLENCVHMTQEEMAWIIDYFDLKNATLLSFSGGKGTFDSSFVSHYCKRQRITGFDDLQFENIMHYLPTAPFGSGGMSKDNLCRLLGIDGVQEIHSGINDCILEWKLFEQLYSRKLFFIGQHLYRYHPDYILPVSYLNRYPELADVIGVAVPQVVGFPKMIFEYVFPRKVLRNIQVFPTNITGITLEHSLNTKLGVKVQNNLGFLAENKKRLEYIGSIETNIESIPVVAETDGTFRSADKKYDEYVDMVNAVTEQIAGYLMPTVTFIKENVFCGETINSQELVKSEGGKILALCDLSSSDAVMEIKTMNTIRSLVGYGDCVDPSVARQLYYERDGRATYLLQYLFQRSQTSGKISDFRIQIYDIDLQTITHEEEKPIVLDDRDVALLELWRWNPELTFKALDVLTGMGTTQVSARAKRMKEEGILINQGSTRKANWLVTDKYTRQQMPAIEIEKQVYVYDKTKYDRHLRGASMVKVFASIADAARDLGLPENYIAIACQSERHLHAKYLFSYEKDKKGYR